MRSVGAKNTGPELAVRKLLHKMGLRFRLHGRDLPGRPDVVLARHRTVVFVHGCFWHGHGCKKGQLPKSRTDYWESKIAANKARDQTVADSLERRGWKAVTVWQCELKEPEQLSARLRRDFPIPPEKSIDSPE